MDSIEVNRLDRMVFVHGQVLWFAIELSSASINDPGAGVEFATEQQEPKLGARIDLEVTLGVRHAHRVADLSSDIEDDIRRLHMDAQLLCMSNVAIENPNRISDACQVEYVRSASRNFGIDDGDFSSFVHKADDKIAANES